jgi:hypothetical protein
VVFYVSNYLCRRCYFHVAVRTIFGEANRTMDLGLEEGDRRASNFRRGLGFDCGIDRLLLRAFLPLYARLEQSIVATTALASQFPLPQSQSTIFCRE